MTAKNMNCSSSRLGLLYNSKYHIALLGPNWEEHPENDSLTEIVHYPHDGDIVVRNYSIIKPVRVSIFSTEIIRNHCGARRVLACLQFLLSLSGGFLWVLRPLWTCHRWTHQISPLLQDRSPDSFLMNKNVDENVATL